MSDMSTQSRFILEEHRHLKDTLGRLRTLVETPAAADNALGALEWSRSLAAALGDFRDTCQHHFEAEERSGFMDHLAKNRSQVQPIVERLRGEHKHMLDELAALVQATQAKSPAGRVDVVGVRSRTGALLDLFERHEHQESEFLSELVRGEFRAD